MSELPEELRDRPPRRSGHEPTSLLTLDAYLRLKAEMDELKDRGRVEMGERLLRAREHGDIRENAEYDAAKDAQGLMEARIRDIEHMLRDPDIVESPVGADSVTTGMLVTVRDEDGGEETYLLADSAEERESGIRTITPASPLGAALVGRAQGDGVAYQAPGGTFTCTVVAFEPHPG